MAGENSNAHFMLNSVMMTMRCDGSGNNAVRNSLFFFCIIDI